jgi:hypothetical protein
MARALAILGGGCVLALLLGAALLASPVAPRHAAVPQGATDVRVESWRQSGGLACQRLSYHLPPGWSLLDQYAYLRSSGLARDATADQALRRAQTEWQSSIFAIFARRSWFGLLAERATVMIAPSGHPRPQVNVDRCVVIEPWAGWL